MSADWSERLPEALLMAVNHWEQRRGAAGAAGRDWHAFTIAVSREVGARGTSVAREVGRRLGWQVYDNELLERIAQEMKLRVNLLESVDERRVSWLQECVESFFSMPTVTETTYVRHLVETLLSLAVHGECVIVGRGAALVLPPASTLRVRLVATPEDRVAVMAQELGLSPQEAARRVESSDRQRTAFIRDHFQHDPADPLNYDLVLNSSRLSVPDCADVIVETLRRLEAQAAAKRRTAASA